MKKLLALLMAMAMILSLAACGSSSDSSDTAAADTAAEESAPAEEAAEETEEAASEEAAEAPAEEDAEDAAEGDYTTTDDENPVDITFSTGLAQDSVLSQSIEYFASLVTERTNGQVTFDFNYGGTICAVPEELSYLQDDGIQMAQLLIGMYSEQLPLSGVQIEDNGDAAAMALAQELYFNDPETSAIAQAEFEAAGIHVLGFGVSGYNLYFAKEDFNSLADLCNFTFGCTRSLDYYLGCGLQAVTVDGGEVYEALRLGNIDACTSNVDSCISNKYYEVVNYMMACPNTVINTMVTINQQTWDSLTEAQQQVFNECALEMMAWNVEHSVADNAEAEQFLADQGFEIKQMSEEDSSYMYQVEVEQTYASILPAAENLGIADDWLTFNQKLVELCTFDINPTLG